MSHIIPMSDIINSKNTLFLWYYACRNTYVWHNYNKKEPTRRRFPFIQKRFEFACKPSSVVYGHLSRLAVADKLKRYSRCSVGRTALLTDTQSCNGWGLHGIPCYQDIGELLPRLSILTANGRPKSSRQKAKPFAAVYFCCTVLKVTFT